MPLTPTDVANKQFNIKMRGYALDEVDAFLDEVEGELARLLRENNDLRISRPAPAPAALPAAAPVPAAAPEPVTPPAPVPTAPPMGSSEGQEAALRTLLLAQRTADEAVAEARAEAVQIVEAAQAEADQTLSAARAEAEQLRTSARQEADSTLSAARSEAERTVTDARQQAAAVEQQAQARVQAATGDLEERRTRLESSIDELRAFEREYRTRLRAYLENQIRDLAGRDGPDEDGGAGVPAGARSAAVGLTPGTAAGVAGRADGPPREGGSRPVPGLAPGPDAVGPFGSEPPTAEGTDRH